ncbi:MAG: hypothetical protein PF904_19990 [Kiritimatiellae bacterium]|jgi:hypothetical protein|nr:hypothetical protein [Kiritimatiellia bacterium]
MKIMKMDGFMVLSLAFVGGVHAAKVETVLTFADLDNLVLEGTTRPFQGTIIMVQ